ncbi:MAG: metallophosphoesterase [Clostridia bacterium]|nr:metallophosphoesterase [Clostridia bacterium]
MKSLKEREWFFSQEKEEFVSIPPRIIYNPDPHYDMYRLKTTRQLVADINLDFNLGLDTPFIIGAVADMHFNVCNQDDREDEELVYTEKCRKWPENLKWAIPAAKALEACDFCDATVVLGDTLDYLSNGSLNYTKANLFKKYPDAMVALGGHDYTKQMQTGIPDKLPLEERLNILRAVWPHDIHYYSRVLANKIIAVVIDNSQTKYLPEQIEKLEADIARAKEEGMIIFIFQHEPIVSKNPAESCARAVIENSGAYKTTDIEANPKFIGGAEHSDEVTCKVYDLITKNADVVKAIFAGHWHSQFYSEVCATYKNGGEEVHTVIPQYILSGNPYHEAGMLARIIVN